jgi:tetratricopeptide (TPR) repeat protein
MKKFKDQKSVRSFVIFMALILTGCLSWKAGWKQMDAPAMTGSAQALLDKAADQLTRADTKEKILALIETYESVLTIDPRNYEALSNLGSYYFLIGYGHADDMDEKEKYYLKAIKSCERAMYTNADFRARVDAGESVWEACGALSKKEMAAIYFWYLAVGNTWNDCLSLPGKIFNAVWPGRARKILPVMMAIDPAWYGGSPYFAYATFYAVAPGFVGGDMEKSGESFTKAIEIGPDKINFRTARARYFHSKRGDREAFERDLKWAIEQDPHRAGDAYPWALFHQRDARKMLQNIDDYF